VELFPVEAIYPVAAINPSDKLRTGAQLLPPDNKSLLHWHWQRRLKQRTALLSQGGFAFTTVAAQAEHNSKRWSLNLTRLPL
jgi:hypothetical protein